MIIVIKLLPTLQFHVGNIRYHQLIKFTNGISNGSTELEVITDTTGLIYPSSNDTAL